MPPLTEQARYQIEHDLRLGLDNKSIAKALGKSVRTIERERKRCAGHAEYTAAQAMAHRRLKAAQSAHNHPTHAPLVWHSVEALLTRKHSPAQVSAAMEKLGESVSVSAIYRYPNRVGKVFLLKHFRHYRAIKKRHSKMYWVAKANKIKDRPKDILTRDQIGHLECDSIVGKRCEAIKVVVLLDRATRYVRLGLVRDGTAAGVARHMAQWLTDPRIPSQPDYGSGIRILGATCTAARPPLCVRSGQAIPKRRRGEHEQAHSPIHPKRPKSGKIDAG